jgi:urease accessory protein
VNELHAHAAVRARLQAGRTRCVVLRSAPPITWRGDGEEVYLVGTAAGPLGGDDHRVDVEVERGARLIVRSAAATIHLPGASGRPSSTTATVSVGAGASLRWLPEPTILAQGCDQRTTAAISLDADASLVWRTETILGRHGEVSGSMLDRLRVDRGGCPLYRSDLALGPAWPHSSGPAGTGDALAVGTVLVVGPAARRIEVEGSDGVAAAAMRIDGDAMVVTALARQPGPLRTLLAAVVHAACSAG